MKRAAGYIRVSTKDQISGESLSTQTESIKKYAQKEDLELVEIYRDEGISGGSVEKRHGLQRCLQDGQQGKFDVLIVHRLSRFGRNARELLQNHQLLEKKNIALYSISENIDFGNKYGKAMLGMFAVMAELERDIITEQLLENRIALAKKGVLVGGKPSAGRIYDREKHEWRLDEKEAGLLRWAAEQYLEGASLKALAKELRRHGMQMSYANLLKVLTEKCGDTYTIKFKGEEEPIVHKVPRILSEDTIQKIKERIAFNRCSNRTDAKWQYVLSGFIRCQECHKPLRGQTQQVKGKIYQYYRHGKPEDENGCYAFHKISLPKIERAVFETIFENMEDRPSFEKAIAESLPDEKKENELKKTITSYSKELKSIERELSKLVEAVISGTLQKGTVKAKEKQLLDRKNVVEKDLEEAKKELENMPDVEQVRKHAEEIRKILLEQYSGIDRLEEMTFEEKRRLLHWLFDGIGPDGTPFGIYVKKHGFGKNLKVDYFLYGRIVGLRTMKGDDINYQYWDEDEEDRDDLIYKTNKPPAEGVFIPY